MKRIWFFTAMVACAMLATPVLRADVKTKEHTLFSLEGALGGVVRLFGGKAARDGITSTVAVKGNRKIRIDDSNGQIIDLSEEKVYTLDMKKKEYTVQTFAEIRAAYEKQRADAEKQMKNMKSDEQKAQDGREMQVDIKITNTGQSKTIAGYETKESVMTITSHEKGKTLEESGGFVLTTDSWMAPKIAALDEIQQFELRYAKAVYGENFIADMQQMASMIAMYPQYKQMASQMQVEGKKITGTPISTTMTFETVASAQATKDAEKDKDSRSSQKDDSSSGGGGGGIGGLLGKKLMAGRGNKDANTDQQKTPGRTKIMTSTVDMLSVETSVAASDVAVPDGFKLKK